MVERLGILMALVWLVGCAGAPENVDRGQGTQVTFRVTQAQEHLGHSTEAGESSGHPVWIDGCRGRIVGTEEEIMVWWNGGEITDFPFQFESGNTYKLTIKGTFGDGVMGFQGKCLHIGQVLKVK
jgi:hypothetical protein